MKAATRPAISKKGLPKSWKLFEMLVLSRNRDETIVIGEDEIRITIVDVRGDKVRVGIEAPEKIPVHRQEVYEAIKRDRKKNNEDSEKP